MNDYPTLAMRTAHDLNPCADFVHAALGLVTEATELSEATDELNAIEEMGDICWFIALADRALEIDTHKAHVRDVPGSEPAPVYAIREAAANIARNASDIADMAKRWHAYGKAPHHEDAGVLLTLILRLVDDLAASMGMRLEQIQATNIAKLQKRFPGKFSEEAAVNRVTRDEREAMEAGLREGRS